MTSSLTKPLNYHTYVFTSVETHIAGAKQKLRHSSIQNLYNKYNISQNKHHCNAGVCVYIYKTPKHIIKIYMVNRQNIYMVHQQNILKQYIYTVYLVYIFCKLTLN